MLFRKPAKPSKARQLAMSEQYFNWVDIDRQSRLALFSGGGWRQFERLKMSQEADSVDPGEPMSATPGLAGRRKAGKAVAMEKRAAAVERKGQSRSEKASPAVVPPSDNESVQTIRRRG